MTLQHTVFTMPHSRLNLFHETTSRFGYPSAGGSASGCQDDVGHGTALCQGLQA